MAYLSTSQLLAAEQWYIECYHTTMTTHLVDTRVLLWLRIVVLRTWGIELLFSMVSSCRITRTKRYWDIESLKWKCRHLIDTGCTRSYCFNNLQPMSEISSVRRYTAVFQWYDVIKLEWREYCVDKPVNDLKIWVNNSNIVIFNTLGPRQKVLISQTTY